MNHSFDIIVIGAGQAGPLLAAKFAESGKKVAIVERKLFGGTCVNTGCIPTKTMIASAHVAHLAGRANDFGIVIDGNVHVDMKKVKARKDNIIQPIANGLEQWLQETKNCTVYKAHAQFEDAHHIRVGDDVLQGEKIFIDVGARAFIPDMKGLEKIPYYTNSTILDIDFVPEHLIIIGGSYVGLEFAQMYRRFGSQVTVIEKSSRLIPKEDPDVSEVVKEILQDEGIDIRLNSECIEFDKNDNHILVKMDCSDANKFISGSHILLAIGRIANTQDLSLEKAEIETDARHFIKVNDQLQTNIPHIWALGECNGKGAFTHTSYNDYERVAANLINGQTRRVSDRILTYALFIDPPLGRAGLTEEEVRASGHPALIGKIAMANVKRAVINGEARGFMKVIVDAKTKHILGAAILGVNGDEVVQSILDVMYAKAPYTVIQNAVHIHPTVSELVPTMLGNLKPL